MGVSDEAKNVIPLKFLRKIKNKNCFPLVNSIRGHTVYSKGSYTGLFSVEFPRKFNVMQHHILKAQIARYHV
jgi:hypothetical protein